MLGPRITQVFRSRWHTLWWATGILLTAYCSIPSKDEPQPASAPPGHAAKHVNPWAKDPK